MKTHTAMIIGLLFTIISCKDKVKNSHASYSSPSPTDSATLFSNGLISSRLNEYNLTFSPDGNIRLYTIANNTSTNRFYTIFITRKEQGRWTKPQIASFSGQFSDADPFFDPTGKKLYFISTRPVTPGVSKSDFDIWYVDYENEKFSSPQHLGNEVNSLNDELYPTVSEKGNLFFSTENGSKGYDLMVSRYEKHKFQRPVPLNGSINTTKTEFDAFVSPDESFIIYTGMNYEDNYGSGDLYLSFNKGGSWSKGKNLGNKVNSSDMDQCPMLSNDRKTLFFTSFRDSQPYPNDKPMTTDEYLNILNSALNGLGNIFWVDLRQVIGASGIYKQSN